MADNFTANPGSGGDTFRADDIGGVKIPAAKINLGADNADDGFVSSSNPLPISGSVTVSGTIAFSNTSLAVTQSGGWVLSANSGVDIGDVTINNATGAAAVNIQDGGNSITVDGTVTANAGTGTFAISAASLPLPSGAATAAKQPALGTAGSASTDVITVQGIASGVALPVSGTVAATQSGTWNIGSITTLPTLANVTTVATVTTVGTLTNITNWGNIVDNAAFTDGTTRLSMSGYIFDEVAGTALTENDGAAARIDSKRAQVLVIEDATTRGQRQAVDASGNASVSNKATATGGATIGKVLSAASTNATNLKGSAGNVFSIALVNTNAAVRYIHLYNKATAPTVGTDVPVATFGIPGNAAGAGISIPADIGAAFTTGIGYSLTTGASDTDTGAVALNEITGWILYK